MKTSTLSPLFFRNLFLMLLLVAGVTVSSWAQDKVLAQYEFKSNEGVSGETNVNTDDDTYAEVETSSGFLGPLGRYSGSIQMKFDDNIPANQWSYIRVDLDGGLIDALLGGSLGDLVGGLVSGILLGDLIIEVSALNSSGTTVLTRDSDQGFGTDRVRLMETGEGHILIGLKPDQEYNRLKFNASTSSALVGLGTTFANKVYNAFTFDDTGDECGRPFATSFDGGGGINLAVADLDDQHLGRAIDEDMNSYSQLKSTAALGAGLGSTLSQFFYFPTKSPETATVNVKLALGSSGLINTDFLGAIEVILYDDNDIIYERSLQSSLLNNTDLLDLLDSGDPVMVTLAPGREFDRMAIKLNSPVGLSLLGDGVKIYDVQRYDDAAGCPNSEVDDPSATNDPFDEASCAVGLIDFDNVDFAQRAVDGNNESYATLHAEAGNLLVDGPVSGFIEVDLGETLPPKKTTYVRIGYDEDVLDRLLGGSLGKLVADLGNNLLLGNQYIQVEAKNGETTVLNENSSNAFEGTADGVVTLVEDNIGRPYLAITPNGSYNRLRISNHVTAVLSTGKKASLDVYEICYEIGEDECFPPNFTSYKGGGVNLSLGDLSDVGVDDPYKAISENSSEYSRINLGVADIAANVYQTIYFNQPSQPNDTVQIRMMIEPSSSLSLDLLGAYKIRFYNGETQVGSDLSLQDGLINNIDLLALFSSGGIVTLQFVPESTFDRVDIGAESIVGLNVAAEPLRIYSVTRHGAICPLSTTPSPFEEASCGTRLIASHNADDVQNIFSDDFDSYATLHSGSESLLGIIGSQYEGYVELGYEEMMPAGTTSYIRIDFDENILQALISGSLGNVVKGILDNLVLGDHYFEVEVKENTYNSIGEVTASTPVASASSNEAGAGGNDAIRVVQDAAGRYYIAVTPDEPYNAVRITDHTNSLLGPLSQPNSMNVYGMCTEMSTDPCLDAFATSYEFTGVNLSVNDLSGAGVTNAEYALDDNTQHYSEISNGTLGVGTSTKQWIFFNSMSTADDIVMIKFRTEGGAADLDVLGGLDIIAWNGNTPVDTLDWQDGIVNGVNVLNLLSNDEMVELPYAPGVEYDRISVGISTLVGVAVFPPVHLYQVERCFGSAAQDFVAWKSYLIDEDPDLKEVKGGEEIEYTIHIRNRGNIDLVDLSIADALPEHTTWVSGGTFENDTIFFEDINVSAGATETVTFVVSVDENLTDVEFISNVAMVKTGPDDPGTPTYPPDEDDPDEPDEEEDPGTDIPVDPIKSVVSWKAYEVDEDKTVTSVSGEETVTYYIYVRNTGNQDLTDVAISDELPAGVTWVSGGTFADGEVTFTLDELGVGETSDPMTFTVTVNRDLTGITEIRNIAVITPDPDHPDDEEESYPPVDNEDPEDPDTDQPPGTPLDVDPSHTVDFTKQGESNNPQNTGQAQIGDEVTYTLTVNNTGNKTLTEVTITDTLPGNYVIVNADGGTVDGNIVSYSIQDLGVDQSESFTLVAEVVNLEDLDEEDRIVNTAKVTFPDEDEVEEKSETATHKIPTACTELNAGDIDISDPDLVVCADEPFSITASTSVSGLTNVVFKWYLTSDLTDVPFEGETLNTSLQNTTTFYVTIEADDHCFNGPAKEVVITVSLNPETPDLSTEDDITDGCDGETILLTASSPGATSYIWYESDVEISGETGSGLEVTESGIYTVVAVNEEGCTSLPSVALEVTIHDLPEDPEADEDLLKICEGETADLADAFGVVPSGVTLVWYADEEKSMEISDPAAVEAGDYYGFFRDQETGCFSENSVEVLVEYLVLGDPGFENCVPLMYAVNDINVTPENVPVSGNVLTNDTGDDLTVISGTYLDENGATQNLTIGTSTVIYNNTGDPAGEITLNADGSYDFTPEEDYTGEVSLGYTAEDAYGVTDGASLTIKVVPVYKPDENNDPIAVDDNVTTKKNTTLTGNVLDNDSDPDGDDLTVISGAQGGTTIPVDGSSVTVSGTDSEGNPVADAGSMTINSDGEFEFTPSADFVGTVDPIVYSIDDGNGGTDSAEVNIRVTRQEADENTTVANDDAIAAPMGSTLSGNVLANDFDPEGDAQSVVSIWIDGTEYSVPGSGDLTESISGRGELSISADGAFTFEPETDFVGTVDVAYEIEDDGTPAASDRATLYLTLLEIDQVLMYAMNDINVTPENVPVSGNVLTNDTGDDLTVISGTYLDENGATQNLTIGTSTAIYNNTGDPAGEITLNTDGSYDFTPEEDYTGEVSLTYTAEDAYGVTDGASLTIKVVPVYKPDENNDPIAVDDNVTTKKNITLTGNVLDNDSDPDGDDLTVISAEQGGTTIPVDGSSVTVSGTDSEGNPVADAGSMTINSDGEFEFTPSADFVGTVDPIVYSIDDGNGGTDSAEVNIRVTRQEADENTTVANDDAIAAPKGTTLSGNVLANDFDPEGDAQSVVSIWIDGTEYNIPGSGDLTESISGRGELSISADGAFTFEPETDFVGTVDVVYEIEDDGTPAASDRATLYLTLLEIDIDGICVEAHVLLQGALIHLTDNSQYVSDDIMRDDLRVKELIPNAQPYHNGTYNYDGDEEITDDSVLGDKGDASVVDWVLLELRDATDPSQVLSRRAALVQRNGAIVDTDGVSCVRFEGMAPGNYYLAVRHRNHLGAMSAAAIDMTSGTAEFDFRTEELYDTEASKEPPVFTRNGYQMLWAGDVNGDGFILYRGPENDKGVIENFILYHSGNSRSSLSFIVKDYSDNDLNMDGEVVARAAGSDNGVIEENILNNATGNDRGASGYINFEENLP